MPKKKAPPSERLLEVMANITDPHNWVTDVEALVQLLKDVPSLRGMAYGNYAEAMFLVWLMRQAEVNGITEITRDDDHKKTKSDRNFTYRGRVRTIQNKSMQTNSIREKADDPGHFTASIQCDASDARDIRLPDGSFVHTTCYAVSEFDILAVPLQPFTGDWDTFAFRTNETLPRSTDSRYTPYAQSQLLATLVRIEYPLDGAWTTDLFSLLPDDTTIVVETEAGEVAATPE